VGGGKLFNEEELIIKNVPYHRQFTDYSCGDASLEMLMHHYGADIDQRAIIDVLRTTSSSGTFSFDLVRGGHFSSLSTAPTGTYLPYPQNVPLKGGWNVTKPLGYGAFLYRSDTCWAKKLKPILNLRLPVITLMFYSDNPSDGGHYRLLVGYDSAVDHFIFHDPWDRDVQPRRVSYSTAEFCRLWNYSETELGRRHLPFAGVFIAPWRVDVNYELNLEGNLTVSAEIEYLCPSPFCDDKNTTQTNIATDAVAIITLPQPLKLADNNPSKIALQTFRPGEIKHVQWQVIVSSDVTVYERSEIVVQAFGVIQGSVPSRSGWLNNTVYDSYNYKDQIGGKGTVSY